ncbi:ComF family protein [Desulfocurvibacter africanus]|uniref:Phosphoribosyltransferase n=2 Tax=Desulfocurvibacter africanus TaxID=873 RepID=F3Z362_DESAF|nr:ComF family protein [Desulfocurvibacter africanus]EGJ50306.1 phosphoribosyltransferase [Desulfocurvibacter africanus subsp. africanus str. Walvis Bay]
MSRLGKEWFGLARLNLAGRLATLLRMPGQVMPAAFGRAAMRVLRLAVGVALSKERCLACYGLRATDSPVCDAVLCAACARELAPRLAGYCPSCGELYAQADDPPHLCAECLRTPKPWDSFFFHGPYAGLLKDILLAFKFRQGLGHARLLQALAAEAFFLRGGSGLPDLLAPVPLHPRRLAWRGYNQSLELARDLAHALDRPLCHSALMRIRHTPPQARLDARTRRINLLGAFRADEAQVEGRRVLLVDDIMTTGATIEQCALVLKAAGASVVDVLVLARA